VAALTDEVVQDERAETAAALPVSFRRLRRVTMLRFLSNDFNHTLTYYSRVG
jgi:hypothetical protein